MFLAICSIVAAAACGGAKSPESTSAEPASQDATEAAPAAEEAPAQPDANAGGAPSGEAPAEPNP